VIAAPRQRLFFVMGLVAIAAGFLLPQIWLLSLYGFNYPPNTTPGPSASPSPSPSASASASASSSASPSPSSSAASSPAPTPTH